MTGMTRCAVPQRRMNRIFDQMLRQRNAEFNVVKVRTADLHSTERHMNTGTIGGTLSVALCVSTHFVMTLPAMAQNNSKCADRERVVERLEETYGESRQSIGLGANNSVVEVFASLETGTWTIIDTNTKGLTCLVASGQSFELTGHQQE